MKYPGLLISLLPISILAQEVNLTIEKSIKVSFQSEANKQYQVYYNQEANAPWAALGSPVVGNGGTVTVFYNTTPDQKVFFKVEGSTATNSIGNRDTLAKLAALDLIGADLTGWDLKGLNLTGSKFRAGTFTRTKFDGAKLTYAELSGNFQGASFVGADFTQLARMEGDFRTANFSNTTLPVLGGGGGAGFIIAGANCENCVMKAFYPTLATNVNMKGAIVNENVFSADWSNSDFRNAHITDSSFDGKLAQANFSGAILISVTFQGAILTNANFTGTTFANVVMNNSNLKGAVGIPQNPLPAGLKLNNCILP